jgi:hypothetical protein
VQRPCKGGARPSWRAAQEGDVSGSRRRGGQVSNIAFNVKRQRLRGGAAGSTAVRALQRSSREGGKKARAFPPRRFIICLFRSAVSNQYCEWYWST